MEELGKEMVEHCGGLPLGILVSEGILATKQSLMGWENVHKNVGSFLGKGNNIEKDQGRLHGILALSYNDLPYELKHCFLYLSKYLEDADIETEPLYQVWMAEGMVSAEDQIGDETMMDVAERYLEELADRYMVIIEEKEEDWSSFFRFKSCRLHDLMREMCLQKAKEENFLELIDYNIAQGDLVESSSISGKSTRLAFHMGQKEVSGYVYVASGKELTRRLRSFSFSIDSNHEHRMKFQFDEFKMLRVLSSIGKLKHLQTLDLRCYSILRIPNAIRKLKRLKHLYLPDERFKMVCKFSLKGLHNLEILDNYNSRNSIDIKELSTLTKLRHLTATVREKLEDVEEFTNQANNLIYLRFFSLDILQCDFCSDKGSTVLKKLFSLSRLNHLCIMYGRTSKLPEYEPCFLPALRTLGLEGIQMEEDPMRTLENLPNLRSLSLSVDSFIGEEIICHAAGFPQLEFLSLGLVNLSNWWIEEEALPNLSRLQIWSCSKMKMIPDGLRYVTTLKKLELYYMPEEFACRLRAQGEDIDKVRHVPSIIFYH